MLDWDFLTKAAWLIYGLIFGLGFLIGFLAGRWVASRGQRGGE